jgi:hypothetical protein
MAVPKNLPNRELWAKEAINSLPPLAAPAPAEVVIPTNEERAVVQAEESKARDAAKKARHK